MARTRGSKNKNPPTLVATLNLTHIERVRCLAILIAEAIAAQYQTENLVAKEFET
jgi:hypothetical protein